MKFIHREELYVRIASDYTTFIRQDKIVLKEPSIVVALNAEKDKYSCAGKDAYRYGSRFKLISCDEVCIFVAAEYMIKSFWKKIKKGIFAPNIIASCTPLTAEIELRAMRDCLRSIAHKVTIICEPYAANAFLQKNYNFNSAIFVNIGLDTTRIQFINDNKVSHCREISDGYSEIYDIIRKYINEKYCVKIGLLGVESILNGLSSVSGFDYTAPQKDTHRPIKITITKSEIGHLICYSKIHFINQTICKLNETLEKWNDVESVFVFGGNESISEYMKLIAEKIHFGSIVPDDCSNVIVKGLKPAYEDPNTPQL